MNKELDEVIDKIGLFFESGEMGRKLQEIQMVMEDRDESVSVSNLQSWLGHTFSSNSLMRFDEAIKTHNNDREEDFRQYLNKLMFEKDITQAIISRRSLIKESSLSRYINGTREIPVYVIFRIALSLKLNTYETATLLRKVGRTFKEDKMDAVIIEAIEQKIFDVIKVEAILRKFTRGEQSLFTKKEREEFNFTEMDFEIEVI